MAWYTWGGWPDILVDFGRELYIAWQLSIGKHLYTDIAYYSGPLAPHLNALWFSLFGVGLRTLVLANLAILVVLIALLYLTLIRLADRFTATIACLFFVMVIAFAQYVFIGNYNYVCPYSHDAVHGLFLCLLSFLLALRALQQAQLAWYAASGLALGLCFLTRSEVFIAGLVGTASLLFGAMRVRRRFEVRQTAAFGLAFGVPIAASIFLLAMRIPLRDAIVGTLGTWPATLNPKVVSLPFFRMVMGTLDLADSISRIGLMTAAYFALLIPPTLIALLRRPRNAPHLPLLVGTFIVPSVALTFYWFDKAPIDWMRPLPLVLLGAIGLWIASLWSGRDEATKLSALMRLSWCALALALLPKIFFQVQLFHYGFYLAMPAALTLVVLMLKWLPDLIAQRGGDARLFRAWFLGVALAVTIIHVNYCRLSYNDKVKLVNAGVDTFRSDWRAPLVVNAAMAIEGQAQPTDTLVALPEGVMLNYLTRLNNPTPHTNFMPTEMAIFGEENILQSLKAHPPEWIALVQKDTREFGPRFFGRDYAVPIMQWIQAEYAPAGLIGDPPFTDEKFGILIMKRKN